MKIQKNSRFILICTVQSLTFKYVWKSEEGKKFEVKHERIMCYDRRNTAAWRLQIKSLDDEARYLIKIRELMLMFMMLTVLILKGFTVGELENGFYMNSFTQQHKYEYFSFKPY